MIIKEILEALNEGEEGGSVIEDLLFSGYQRSCRAVHSMTRGEYFPSREDRSISLQKTEQHNFKSLMSKLKREGLVVKKKGSQNYWKITKKGRDKLVAFQLFGRKYLRKRFPKLFCTKEKDFLKIISFDIPEKDRAKRDWLRRELRAMDFESMQKSVWVGKSRISEDFVNVLRELNLLSYVHIFEIRKTGSLQKLRKC